MYCVIKLVNPSKDPITGVHYARIPVNFRPLSRMSMDEKHMMPSKFGYNRILLRTCEISGYVIGIPIQDFFSQFLKQSFSKYVVFLENQKTNF